MKTGLPRRFPFEDSLAGLVAEETPTSFCATGLIVAERALVDDLDKVEGGVGEFEGGEVRGSILFTMGGWQV